MNIIKILIIICALAFFVKCKSESKTENKTSPTETYDDEKEAPQFVYEISKEEKSEPKKAKPKQKLEVSITDDIIKNKALQLESGYDYVPFFYEKNGMAFFYVVKGEFKGSEPFDNNKYGLVDTAGHVILDCIYDKIYTPNLVFENCVEIEENGLVGLYNFKSNETLEPQFKYIITDTTNACYGLYNNALIQLNPGFNIDYEDHYALMHVLPKFSFIGSIEAEKGFLVNNYFNEFILLNGYENDASKLLITPSFLSINKLLPQVLGNLNIDHGSGPYAEIIEQKKTDDGIFSAILEFYDGTFDVRDITPSTIEGVSFSIENNYPEYTLLNESLYRNGGEYVKYKSDSVIEIRIYDDHKMIDKGFNYYLVSENGLIQTTTNRKYNFTKYTKIDNSYLEGPFEVEMTDSIQNEIRKFYKEKYGDDGYMESYLSMNFACKTDYSIKELDIMRNEIFADYGYNFKSEKWQEYFSQFSWYKPKYDNVDDQLTEIDKHNIKVILKHKEEIESGKIQVKIQGCMVNVAG